MANPPNPIFLVVAPVPQRAPDTPNVSVELLSLNANTLSRGMKTAAQDREEREKEEERKARLDEMMRKIRGEFGEGAVMTGADLRDSE